MYQFLPTVPMPIIITSSTQPILTSEPRVTIIPSPSLSAPRSTASCDATPGVPNSPPSNRVIICQPWSRCCRLSTQSCDERGCTSRTRLPAKKPQHKSTSEILYLKRTPQKIDSPTSLLFFQPERFSQQEFGQEHCKIVVLKVHSAYFAVNHNPEFLADRFSNQVSDACVFASARKLVL